MSAAEGGEAQGEHCAYFADIGSVRRRLGEVVDDDRAEKVQDEVESVLTGKSVSVRSRAPLRGFATRR
jgi:hypothetical protein